jgi:hypothetical protein
MNAPLRTVDLVIADFVECCEHQAWFFHEGWLPLQTAVDNLQRLAERWGLVEEIGQDELQRLIAGFPVIIPRINQPAEPEPTPAKKLPYRPPQATVDAFWYVVRTQSADYLAKWLAGHPADAAHLHRLWESKCLSAAA